MADHVTGNRMLLALPEAAEALGVSARHLWELSIRRREIPCVRVGRRIMYSPEALRAWIAAQQQSPLAPMGGQGDDPDA